MQVCQHVDHKGAVVIFEDGEVFCPFCHALDDRDYYARQLNQALDTLKGMTENV